MPKQIDQDLIRFSVLRRKPRELIAEVGTIKRSVFVDFPCQEALTQRAVWNKANSELLKGRQHFLLRIPVPKRVFALDSGDRLNWVCATDRLRCCFRHAEVLDLALLNEVLHGSRDVFDRNLGVHTVLIVEIDGINHEPLERAFDRLLDVLRPAIQPQAKPGLPSGLS